MPLVLCIPVKQQFTWIPVKPRKQTLKKYLLSAVVPITTICNALGFKLSGEIHTDEPVEEVCQLILENIRIKIEYLKSRYKNDYVSNFVREIVMEKINPKLKKYITLTDFHCGFKDDFQVVNVQTCVQNNKYDINVLFSYFQLFLNNTYFIETITMHHLKIYMSLNILHCISVQCQIIFIQKNTCKMPPDGRLTQYL